MIEIFNGSVYNFGSSSSIWVIIGYEKQRNGADMQYRFNYKIRLANRSGGTASSASYQNNVQTKLYLNGLNVWTKNVQSSSTNWDYEYETEWFTVANKTLGTAPFRFTVKDTINSSWCNYSSSTYQLDIDPAGSDFNTISNFNIGQPFTITTTKYDTDMYDKLVIKLGEVVLKTLDNIETSVLIDFSEEELNTIYELTTNVQYADFTFAISSFEDEEMSSQIGITNEKVVKGYIIASNPIITSKSAIDTNDTTIALTGDNTKLIKGYSNVKVNVVAAGQNQATIKTIIVNNEIAENGFIAFDKITTNVFNITVIDSREFQTTGVITLDMIDYLDITLNVNVLRNEPTDSKVKINYSGNCFKGSFGAVENTLNVQYRFKEKGQEFTEDDKWTDMAPTINDNNTFQEENFVVDDVDYKKVYEFQVRAVDKLTEWLITGIVVKKGEPTVHVGEDFVNIYGDIEQNGQNINKIYAGLELTGDLKELSTFNKESLTKAINSLLPAILYDNEDGSNENIELSDTTENYKYIDIYYIDNNATPNYGFTRVYNPNGKYTFLHIISLATTGGGHYLKTRTVEIIKKQIATVETRYGQAYLRANNYPTVAQENYIYITKVLGYK